MNKYKYFEKKLDIITDNLYNNFHVLINEIQEEVLNPFCDKYDIKFIRLRFRSSGFEFTSFDEVSLNTFSMKVLEEKYGKEFIVEYNEMLDLLQLHTRQNDYHVIKYLSTYE